MVALQSLFSAKALHCRFAPVLSHSGSGLLFSGIVCAVVGAVHSSPTDREGLSTVLAAFCGQSLQGCFQFRVVGQNRITKVAAHCAVRVADAQHGAFTVQRKTAVVSVIVGAAPGHQLSDGASFSSCQFSFCHRHIFPFLNLWENEKMPAGIGEHLTSSLWLWGNFQKTGESLDRPI